MLDSLTGDGKLLQNYRRNFFLLVCDFALFGFGMSFVSMVTILPVFVSSLTTSSVAVGMISSIMILGFNLPQIFVSRKVEAFPKKKPYLMKITLGERIPWLLLAILSFAQASSMEPLLLSSFFILYAVISISGGLGAPAWLEIVAEAIPETRRGAFFGISNFASSALSVMGGIAAGLLIQNIAFPLGYGACFLSAFVIMMAGYYVFSKVEEIGSLGKKNRADLQTEGLLSLQIVREDANFRRFLVATLVSGIGGMASSFFMVHAINVLSLREQAIGLFTAAFAAAQILSNLLWAYLGDLKGHKAVLLLSGLLSLLASLVCIFSVDVAGFLIVFLLAGASSSAYMVSAFSILMDFAPSERRPTYYGVTGMIRAPFAALGPVLGGIIADAMGYPPVFMLSCIASAIGAMLLSSVQEPRIWRNKWNGR
mgnify:CR=1 FL=1